MLLRRAGVDRRQNENGELPGGERRLASRRADTDDSSIANEYEELEEQLTNLHTGINRSLGFYRSANSRIRKLRRHIDRSDLNEKAKKLIYSRLKDLSSICSLGIKEVLFSYWHILHLPLFIMLILSGVVHVAAVHLY